MSLSYVVITTYESEFYMMDTGNITESFGLFSFVEDAFKTVDAIDVCSIAYKHSNQFMDGFPKEVDVSKQFGKGFYRERHRIEFDLKEANGYEKTKSYAYVTIMVFEELA